MNSVKSVGTLPKLRKLAGAGSFCLLQFKASKEPSKKLTKPIFQNYTHKTKCLRKKSILSANLCNAMPLSKMARLLNGLNGFEM